MDFKKIISHIESIDGPIETPKAPAAAAPIRLDEDTELRVLAGVTALTESIIVEKAHKIAKSIEKNENVETEEALKEYESKDGKYTHKGSRGADYDGSDHVEEPKKKEKSGMTGAERQKQKAQDKAEEKKGKEWEAKHGKDSVTRHKMEAVNTEEFTSKFLKMVEDAKMIEAKKEKMSKKDKKMDEVVTLKPGAKERAEKEKKEREEAEERRKNSPPVSLKKKPMGEASKPDFLDLDKDGDKKEPMKSAAKSKNKDKKDSGKKGMSAKQAKYFGGKNESIKTSKKVVAESIEQTLTFRDMMKLVVESGGQQRIDPLDKELFVWAERVANSKIGEGMKAEIYAGMVYERMGGRFEMYDVLAEDSKNDMTGAL